MVILCGGGGVFGLHLYWAFPLLLDCSDPTHFYMGFGEISKLCGHSYDLPQQSVLYLLILWQLVKWSSTGNVELQNLNPPPPPTPAKVNSHNL